MRKYASEKWNLKTNKGLTLVFEQDTPSQKTKFMCGQASQKVMVEINKFIGKGVIEYTEHEKRVYLANFLPFKIWWNQQTNTEFESLKAPWKLHKK